MNDQTTKPVIRSNSGQSRSTEGLGVVNAGDVFYGKKTGRKYVAELDNGRMLLVSECCGLSKYGVPEYWTASFDEVTRKVPKTPHVKKRNILGDELPC